jgi:hypothetical protein
LPNGPGILLVTSGERSLAIPPAQRVAPFVLDMTPLDLDHTEAVGLPVGQSWTDPDGLSPLGKFKITLNSADTHTANVTVQTVPGATDPAPVVPDVTSETIPQATIEITAAGLRRPRSPPAFPSPREPAPTAVDFKVRDGLPGLGRPNAN